FFSSRRRHTRFSRDWSSDVCSSDLEYYARQVLTYSFLLANLWAFGGYFLGLRYSKPKLALVPFGRGMELADTPRAVVTILTRPDLDGRRYDGIVADLHSVDLQIGRAHV